MVAARAPDLCNFSEGGPTGWTLGGFLFFLRGPQQRVPASAARTHVREREPGARVEPGGWERGCDNGRSRCVCLRSSGRALAPPSRCIAEMHFQAVSKLLLSVPPALEKHLRTQAKPSGAENEAVAIPGQRRQVPFHPTSTVTSTLLRSTGGLAIRSAVELGRPSACRTTAPLPGLVDAADF